MIIETIKEVDNGWFINNGITIPSNSENRHYQEVQDAINGIGNYEGNPIIVEPEFTSGQIEVQRQLLITAEATRIIEVQYSPLKQRKLMSIAIALQDKQIQGLTLTTEEEILLQTNRDINTWITDIRVIENLAIYNNTLLIDIDWDI